MENDTNDRFELIALAYVLVQNVNKFVPNTITSDKYMGLIKKLCRNFILLNSFYQDYIKVCDRSGQTVLGLDEKFFGEKITEQTIKELISVDGYISAVGQSKTYTEYINGGTFDYA